MATAHIELEAPDPGYSADELRQVMCQHYDKLIDFVTSEPFLALMSEMSDIPHWQRPIFVHDVLLDDDELRKRGVTVPDGILIQRSAFGDRRPTLFAVKHFLPDGYRDIWENVNLTFDNDYLNSDISKERAVCLREPLPPAQQAQAMVGGVPLENVNV